MDYIVNKGEKNKPYGIYEFFTKHIDEKVLGMINGDVSILKTDIADHNSQHWLFYDKYGPYNLWFIPYEGDIYYLDINFVDKTVDERIIPKKITSFQYEAVIGLLEDSKKVADELNVTIKINICDGLFLDDLKSRIVTYPYDESLLSEGEKRVNIIEDYNTVYSELRMYYNETLIKEEEEEIDNLIEPRLLKNRIKNLKIYNRLNEMLSRSELFKAIKFDYELSKRRREHKVKRI